MYLAWCGPSTSSTTTELPCPDGYMDPTTFDILTLVLSGAIALAGVITAAAALVSSRNVRETLKIQTKKEEERRQQELLDSRADRAVEAAFGRMQGR